MTTENLHFNVRNSSVVVGVMAVFLYTAYQSGVAARLLVTPILMLKIGIVASCVALCITYLMYNSSRNQQDPENKYPENSDIAKAGDEVGKDLPTEKALSDGLFSGIAKAGDEVRKDLPTEKALSDNLFSDIDNDVNGVRKDLTTEKALSDSLFSEINKAVNRVGKVLSTPEALRKKRDEFRKDLIKKDREDGLDWESYNHLLNRICYGGAILQRLQELSMDIQKEKEVVKYFFV